jgi:hypothetical protein
MFIDATLSFPTRAPEERNILRDEQSVGQVPLLGSGKIL